MASSFFTADLWHFKSRVVSPNIIMDRDANEGNFFFFAIAPMKFQFLLACEGY